MISPPLSRFRYFTQRLDYLHWLGSPEGQPTRRPVERAVIQSMQSAPTALYCHAHNGEAELVPLPLPLVGEAPNWRESGTCAVCGNISRVRLAAEWIHRASRNYAQPRVYVTEQLTPLYKALLRTVPSVVGSEYVPDAEQRAKSSVTLAMYTENEHATIRHEDICALTFTDASLDLIGSFDVLEHVPEYGQALREFHRVLSAGGQVLLTAPFLTASATTLVRARIENGVIVHLEPAEYHGNPTIPEDGVLCFYHFGWDLLDALRAVGFRSVALLDAWGCETAVFGDQCAIVATK